MSFNKNFRRTLIIAGWCLAALAGIVLLVAAINRKSSRKCLKSRIEINGGATRKFLDPKDVMAILTADGKEKLTGKTIASYDLKSIEEQLERNAWIRDAQVFFDNNEVLRIKVTERDPVARLFTAGGSSFLIDSAGKEMPLSGKTGMTLPVFTNFPGDRVREHGTDSVLVSAIRKLAVFIREDGFWSADIQQINIGPDHEFQMIPLLGNHLIEFGDASDYAGKFHRLLLFYRQVLSKTGFDRYSRIDLRFTGQIIGTKRESRVSRTDSLQAIRNVQQMIRLAGEMPVDTARQAGAQPLEHNQLTEQTLTSYDLVPDQEDSVVKKKTNNMKKKR
jgi:cell division protein FtsQ